MMYVADYRIRTFVCGHTLVYQVVHLLWKAFCNHPKYGTLPGSEEIDQSWLEGVDGIVHLLHKIKRVVHRHISGTWITRSQLHTRICLDGCLTLTDHGFHVQQDQGVQVVSSALFFHDFWKVAALVHSCIVALALPTQIRHWLRSHNEWQDLLPHT